jgi:hypothetical protein
MAPGIISRKSVCEPMQTGITAIDTMIPVAVVNVNLSLVTVKQVRHQSRLIQLLTKKQKMLSVFT